MNKGRLHKIMSMILISVLTVLSIYSVNKSMAATAGYLTVKYDGKLHAISKKNQTIAKVDGVKVKTSVKGLIISGTNMVGPTVIKKAGITYSYNKTKKVVTLKHGGNVIKITMGKKNVTVNGVKKVMGTKALRVYYVSLKKTYNLVPARFVFETFGMKYKWNNSNSTCYITTKVKATATPTVSPAPEVVTPSAIVPTEPAEIVVITTPVATATVVPSASPIVSTATPSAITTGSGIATGASVTTESAVTSGAATIAPYQGEEMKAMWISYLEFGNGGYTEEQFTKKMATMFDNCKTFGMNAVIVQIRPFSDAMYKSDYFPWSKYASGTMGVDPGYDPMEIMITLAHKRGLQFHAWLNPYRITLSNTNVNSLPDNHPAKKWKNNSDDEVKRRVLSFNGNLYYNPSNSAVRSLIANGVKEICTRYDVDGIHFDDYFYPNLGTSYASKFDAEEYNAYKSDCEEQGKTAKSIVSWRRTNVNTLVKKVYATVKKVDPNIVFGISPAGNIDNLMSKNAYYVNVSTWMANDNYVDYICPQIYWSFQNSTCPYAATVDRWASLKKNNSVRLFIGLAVYRGGSNVEKEWSNSSDVLKRQILYGRTVNAVSGFAFYRYDSFFQSAPKKEVKNMLPLLKNN
ncbi:MAG: family 10 glycosylhydrolase [Lachnospiraceae bacterium]|nr:family 10 glycosylhydrolase [Lachnospiraceae bacterium]